MRGRTRAGMALVALSALLSLLGMHATIGLAASQPPMTAAMAHGTAPMDHHPADPSAPASQLPMAHDPCQATIPPGTTVDGPSYGGPVTLPPEPARPAVRLAAGVDARWPTGPPPDLSLSSIGLLRL